MCMSKPKMPKALPPPPPPPPPSPTAQVEPASARPKNYADLNKKGKRGLRIDRTINSTGSSGNGLNIPG